MAKKLLFILALCISTVYAEESDSLKRLVEGNQRFMDGNLKHPNRSAESRQENVTGQAPFAIIVGCADSRAAPEILFDQGIGDLFVVRVAGNVIGPLELDSIEFAALYLKSSVILVLGHQNCGAVDAVIQGTTKDIESVAQLIEPAVKSAKQNNPPNLLEAATKANAIRMKEFLLRTPAIRQLVADKKLDVQAGYYHLKSGEVEIL